MVQQIRLNEEASTAADIKAGRPVLEVDDTIIVDNLLAHHGEAERALREFLEEMSIELAYSPDLNPVEEAFSKLKHLLKYRYQRIVHWNLE